MQVCLNPAFTLEPTLSWYRLPVKVKRLLNAAASTWKNDAAALQIVLKVEEEE